MLKALRDLICSQASNAAKAAETILTNKLKEKQLSDCLALALAGSDKLTCDLDLNPVLGLCVDDGPVTTYIRGYLQLAGLCRAANEKNVALGGEGDRVPNQDIKAAYTALVVAHALVRECTGPRSESLLRLSSAVDMSDMPPGITALVRNHAPGAVPPEAAVPAQPNALPIEAAPSRRQHIGAECELLDDSDAQVFDGAADGQ